MDGREGEQGKSWVGKGEDETETYDIADGAAVQRVGGGVVAVAFVAHTQ